MATPFISLEKISKVFPKKERHAAVTVFENIDLTVYKGEFLILLGPSGCGKSTLLRIMAGLDHASHGHIVFAPSFTREQCSFVFQDFGILPWLTIAENVSLHLIAHHIPAAERDKRVHDILAVFHLEKFAHRMPHELSGGMKQRVGLARAFVNNPTLIWLDEPFSELDFFTASSLRTVLLELQKKYKTTIIMVSHYIDEAVLLADRIAIFSDRPSRITKIVKNTLPRPRNPRSAEFFQLEDTILGHFEQDTLPIMGNLATNGKTRKAAVSKVVLKGK